MAGAAYHKHVNVDAVLTQYQARLSQVQAGMEQARSHAAVAALAFVAVAIVAVVLVLKAQWWMSLIPVALAAAAGRSFLGNRAAGGKLRRLAHSYRRAITRVQGEWAGAGVTGDEFDDPNHPYAHDLNLFGKGSLFELLAIGRSGIGQTGLAKYLKEPAGLDQARSRQQAVQELSGLTDLRERVALLGPYQFSEASWETFSDWLDAPATEFPHGLKPVLLATSTLLGTLILAGVATGGILIPWIWLARLAAPLVVFHAVAGMNLRQRVTAMIDSLRALRSETRLLREGLELLETGHFQAPKLQQLTARARGGASAVSKLERMFDGLGQRNNDFLLYPSRLLMVGTQLAMAIEQWRLKYGPALRQWMEAWAEFEALNALGGYAYEHPENSFPLFASGPAVFEATALAHPLLARQGCVSNEVALNPDSRFYIVSGSNMSGKSTLLRTIGQNAVLAFAGAPVRAEALRMSTLTLCASINVADSLLNGKSKFLAEVDRLKLAIDTAQGATPLLFLVDEIFSGTNSVDRRAAAEAVIRTLVERGAIGALSTHDLALTQIAADPALHGSNVHMGSRGGGDPMEFDYRLKPGVTREANALAIARMAGVPV